MLKIGITGGIGSGKTTVCKMFEMLDIPVYYADEKAKMLMQSEPILKKGIKNLFGQESYYRNGRLNRKYIAGIVFNNHEKITQLNNLVHPAVALDSLKWNDSQNAAYTLKEAALLIESGSYKEMDFIIVVTCPEDIRIQRVMYRDKITKDQVLSRINKQMPEEQKINYADFIILNDGQHSLISQVIDLHRTILGKTKK